jgi:hypothetical protein
VVPELSRAIQQFILSIGMDELTILDSQDGGKVNKEFVPDIEIFTRSRAPWMKPVESATQAEADFTKEFLAGYFG